MGVFSTYIASTGSADTCKIRWETINKDIIDGFYPFRNINETNKPSTLEELAHIIDYSKLFDYLHDKIYEAFLELNKNLEPNGCFPRLYFEKGCYNTIVYLEFHPGTDTILYGVSEYDDIYYTLKDETIKKEWIVSRDDDYWTVKPFTCVE